MDHHPTGSRPLIPGPTETYQPSSRIPLVTDLVSLPMLETKDVTKLPTPRTGSAGPSCLGLTTRPLALTEDLEVPSKSRAETVITGSGLLALCEGQGWSFSTLTFEGPALAIPLQLLREQPAKGVLHSCTPWDSLGGNWLFPKPLMQASQSSEEQRGDSRQIICFAIGAHDLTCTSHSPCGRGNKPP